MAERDTQNEAQATSKSAAELGQGSKVTTALSDNNSISTILAESHTSTGDDKFTTKPHLFTTQPPNLTLQKQLTEGEQPDKLIQQVIESSQPDKQLQTAANVTLATDSKKNTTLSKSADITESAKTDTSVAKSAELAENKKNSISQLTGVTVVDITAPMSAESVAESKDNTFEAVKLADADRSNTSKAVFELADADKNISEQQQFEKVPDEYNIKLMNRNVAETSDTDKETKTETNQESIANGNDPRSTEFVKQVDLAISQTTNQQADIESSATKNLQTENTVSVISDIESSEDSQSSAGMSEELRSKVVRGVCPFNELPPMIKKCVRIFLSSTFSGTW